MVPYKKRKFHSHTNTATTIIKIPISILLFVDETERAKKQKKKKPVLREEEKKKEKPVPLDRQHEGQERRSFVNSATFTVIEEKNLLHIVYKKGCRSIKEEEIDVPFLTSRDALGEVLKRAVEKDNLQTSFDYERLSIEYSHFFWNAVYHFKKSPDAINEWLQMELGLTAPSAKRRRRKINPPR